MRDAVNKWKWKSFSILILSEVAILTAVALLVTGAWPGTKLANMQYSASYRLALILVAIITLVYVVIACIFYKNKNGDLGRLLPAVALTLVVMAVLIYLVPQISVDGKELTLASALSIAGITVSRSVFTQSLKNGSARSKILFLGTGVIAKECNDLILKTKLAQKYVIAGFIPLAGENSMIASGERILQEKKSLRMIAEHAGVDEVIVSVDNRRGGAFPIDQLLQCKLHGIKVIDATAFFERELRQIRIDSLQPSWLVFGHGFDQSFFRRVCKRTVDLVMSMLLLLLTWPLLLATAVAIFIEDRGSIFYRQERVGFGGETFMVLKFRSMRKDAETGGNPKWAAANDDRATRVGRFIRKFRIDEIPQIINVLNGDMSFVGPRPERPFFVTKLTKEVQFYDVRHSIKPGITGLAQVRYQYGASVADAIQKLQYDLYYVKNNSLLLDVMILLETLQVVIFGKGAR